jgi:hypothetical protein
MVNVSIETISDSFLFPQDDIDKVGNALVTIYNIIESKSIRCVNDLSNFKKGKDHVTLKERTYAPDTCAVRSAVRVSYVVTEILREVYPEPAEGLRMT